MKLSKSTWIPKKKRTDILDNLSHGAQSRIAKDCNVSRVQVSKVLTGERKDYSGIIKAAEIEAAINIWKSKYCKFKSEL